MIEGGVLTTFLKILASSTLLLTLCRPTHACAPSCDEWDGTPQYSEGLWLPEYQNCVERSPFLEPFNGPFRNLELLMRAYGYGGYDVSAWQYAEERQSEIRGVFSDKLRKFATKYNIASVNPALAERMSHYRFDAATPYVSDSNSYAPVVEFLDGLDSARLQIDQVALLIDLRLRLHDLGIERSDNISHFLEQVNERVSRHQSASLDHWISYLKGAWYFTQHDRAIGLPGARDLAFAEFKKLADSPDTHASSRWPRETAQYLLARILLIKSQGPWDGTDEDRSLIDHKIIGQVSQAIRNYERKFPHGIYEKSLIGMERRIAFLNQANQTLHDLELDAFRQSLNLPDRRNQSERAAEAMNHLSKAVEDSFSEPLLATARILKTLELGYKGSWTVSPAAPMILHWYSTTYAEKFSRFPGLLPYLKALIFYNLKDFEKAAAETPVFSGAEQLRASPIGYEVMMGISHLILKANSLEKLNDFDEARQIWTDLLLSPSVLSLPKEIRVRIEAGLARNYLRAQKIEDITAPPSWINIERIRKQISDYFTWISKILKKYLGN